MCVCLLVLYVKDKMLPCSQLQSTDVHPTQIQQQVQSNPVATGMSNMIPNTIPGSPTEMVTPLYDPPLLITQDSLLDTTVTTGDTTQGNSRPQRARKIKKFYDPSTGSYVDGNPRGVLK